MGVQGLKAQLERFYRPEAITLHPESKVGQGEILLVDAKAVEYLLCKRLPMESNYQSEDWSKAYYEAVSAFFQSLQRTGLEVVCILEGAVAGALLSASVDRRAQEILEAHKCLAGPAATMIFVQVLIDLDVKFERALHATDQLVLSYYLRREPEIFALLTNDTDFFVYGVEKLVFTSGMTVDKLSTTFERWRTKEAWAAWRSNRTAKGRAVPVSLMHRSQIAAILGSEMSKEVRLKPRSQRTKRLTSPLTIAELILSSPHDDALTVAFFTEELGMKKFTEEDLAMINETMQEYIDDVAAAQGTELVALKANEVTLPWLHTSVSARLGGAANVPQVLCELAASGVAVFPVLEEDWDSMLGAQQAAAAAMFKEGSARTTFLYNCYTTKLRQLTLGGSDEAWFKPLAETEVEAASLAGLSIATLLKATLPKTVEAVKAAAPPNTSHSLAAMHAVLLHAASPDGAEPTADEVRMALLPGVAGAASHTVLPAEVDPEEINRSLAEQALASGLTVDTGSALSTGDWMDIDAKDLVKRAKATVGFKIMREIQPWTSAATGAQALVEGLMFRFFYCQRKDDMYKNLAKKCFPDMYAEARDGTDKELARELKAITKEFVLEELKKMKEKRTINYLEAVSRMLVPDLLFMRREALKAGPNSIEWNAAKTIWGTAGDRAKEESFEVMHTSENRMGVAPGAAPRRFKHQEDLMQMVATHLTDLEKNSKTLPLHVILATPTGSGKTFTAVMMHLHLLREHHPDAILLYSVPTKQVLKRVGQECEAHGVIYWTAAKHDELFQVRRPYSIRNTSRKKIQSRMTAEEAKALNKSAGSGTIEEQMQKIHETGVKMMDAGLGKPGIIVADVYTTAALLKASRGKANRGSFWNAENLILYFDEPNMGINLDPAVSVVVHNIMRHAPATAILASATMPSWDSLPFWWKGDGAVAKRPSICLEPYELPICKLQILDEKSREITPVSLLGLFKTHAEFVRTLQQEGMRRIVMLRHLTPPQANELLSDGKGGGSKMRDWMALSGDVRTLRENVEPALLNLSAQRFEELTEAWKEKRMAAPTKAEGLASAISVTGVTMIATLDARGTALEVARMMKGGADVHEVKRRMRDCEKSVKAAEKEASKKKDDDDFMGGEDSGGSSGMLDLRGGLSVSLADAQECDDDTLMMLSKGVAYSLASGTEPLVKKLYLQALLHVPEHVVAGNKRSLPPIHVLVVDYSSIYGTDCPAVDTIIMDDALGRHLSWEDHQQFLGRLRRDGTAVYTSKHTLRCATLGKALAGDEEETEAQRLQRYARTAVLVGVTEHKCEKAKCVDLIKQIELPVGHTFADIARATLHAILELTFPAAKVVEIIPGGLDVYPATTPGGEKELPQLLKDLKQRLAAFKPVLVKGLEAGREQLKAMRAFEEMCIDKNLFKFAYSAGVRYIGAVLKLLYDEELFEEPALLAWAQQKEKSQSSIKSQAADKFVLAATPFITWLKEAEDEDESEEEEDDEE